MRVKGMSVYYHPHMHCKYKHIYIYTNNCDPLSGNKNIIKSIPVVDMRFK